MSGAKSSSNVVHTVWFRHFNQAVCFGMMMSSWSWFALGECINEFYGSVSIAFNCPLSAKVYVSSLL